MKKRKLRRKLTVFFVTITIILILCTSFGVAALYWNNEMNSYSELAYSYTRTLAEYIDGDTIAYYLETEEKDDYYNEIMDLVNATQAETDLKYYYVFVPYEDDLVYIWDANNLEGAMELGAHEEYMEGGKEAVEAIYKQDPPEEISITRDAVYGYIVSAYSPVFDSDGNPVAVVGVDLSMGGIRNTLLMFIVFIVAIVIIIIAIAMIVFYTFINRNVVKPVDKLNTATKKIVSNIEKDETVAIDIHTGDEIEELSQSFMDMNSDLKAYIKELSRVTSEKERIGAELDIATHIQSSMLPCIFPAFPDRKEFDVYATMNPAKEVGGDFYDFFMVDDRHLAVVMADVSGKGVPAALFMVIGKTLIKDHTQSARHLGDVFTAVNNMLCDSNSEGMFITAFEGIPDLMTGDFYYANAGHEFPYICKKGESYEPYKIKPGFVLAGMEDMVFKDGHIVLEPGDKIFLYTDGVPEATDGNNELYGTDRLKAVLDKNKDKTPEELLPEIKADVDRFVGDAPQFDDITMLCLEYKERMTSEGEAL